MPWCEPCQKWRSPNALLVDGTCPRCGTACELGTGVDGTGEVEKTSAAVAQKIPWHFWLMVAATGLYLGWRVVQGITWLF